jgi:hypothetical protein
MSTSKYPTITTSELRLIWELERTKEDLLSSLASLAYQVEDKRLDLEAGKQRLSQITVADSVARHTARYEAQYDAAMTVFGAAHGQPGADIVQAVASGEARAIQFETA